TGPLIHQSIRNLEETRMNSDDERFFENDEEEEYEDEEYDEEEEEEEDDFPDEDYDDIEDEYDTLDIFDRTSSLSRFADDPWPTTTFFLMLAGFLLVFAPEILWAGANRYFTLAVYILLVLCGVAITFSIVTWEKGRDTKGWIRWAGVTNLVVVVLCAIVGTLDSISWVVSAQSIIPGITSPLISFIMVLVVFSLYTLWIVQKNFAGPRE
ncbi:MAG: hypothetical protein ACFFEE_12445, partial [Candidatus Thorarchaeota archaeon]